MPKTMVANIPGARLREAERQLAELRGADAVNDYLEAHPNETKVLQQLVDMRRAGKPAPPLARVQRAMLWSDGTIEFSTVAGPEPPARADRSGRPPGGRPASGGPGRGPGGAPGAAPGYGRGPARGPGGGPSSGPGRGPGGRPGGPGFGGGRRPGGPPGQRRDGREGRYGDREDTSHLPREGEGWALVRPGDLERERAAAEAAALAAEAAEDEAAGTEEEASVMGEPVDAGEPGTAVAPVAQSDSAA